MARRERGDVRWIFHIWLGACCIFYLAAAREITSNPWNFHVFHAPIAALAGHGLITLMTLGSRRPGQGVALARGLLLVGLLAFTSHGAIRTMKTPYAADAFRLGQKLDALCEPGDLVIAVGSAVGDPIAVYYSRRRGWVFPAGGGQRDWSRLHDDPDEAIAEFNELWAAGARWFAVPKRASDGRRRNFIDHQPELMAHLDSVGERVVDDDRHLIYRLPRSP